jgi:hypothetical protein
MLMLTSRVMVSFVEDEKGIAVQVVVVVVVVE